MQEDFIKITNAAYKILDFFPENEPLKNRSKEKALQVLDGLTCLSESGGWVLLKNYLSQERQALAVKLIEDIEILENYLRLAKHQGWLENVNLIILLSEYEKIKNHVSSIYKLKPLESIATKPMEVLKDSFLQFSKQTNLTINQEKKPIHDFENLNKRQKKIIEILTNRESAQVADIIKQLPNITKRTIRRDLDALLKRGKVLRIGAWNQAAYKINR